MKVLTLADAPVGPIFIYTVICGCFLAAAAIDNRLRGQRRTPGHHASNAHAPGRDSEHEMARTGRMLGRQLPRIWAAALAGLCVSFYVKCAFSAHATVWSCLAISMCALAAFLAAITYRIGHLSTGLRSWLPTGRSPLFSLYVLGIGAICGWIMVANDESADVALFVSITVSLVGWSTAALRRK
ncbi:hypothetical protein [Burkholderia pseudomallei]|uniref:hypothetical protein n=1 Tax=Burkholderia pseudomallei TaxID=28450 RepID=UPI00052AA76A|nr:hypothetical protein [Burkholderia pseudomallei]AIV63652.1 putative membrane protein [Burkholderia pseudomallei K42]